MNSNHSRKSGKKIDLFLCHSHLKITIHTRATLKVLHVGLISKCRAEGSRATNVEPRLKSGNVEMSDRFYTLLVTLHANNSISILLDNYSGFL